MKISACYIVKNEAAVLERSIASLRGCADEILVVDTGSTDDAPQIAARCGARVVSHAWQEDFAEARNFALSEAKGDWIVFLDADEYFTPETAGNIRSVIERSQEAQALLVQRQDIDADQGGRVMAALFVLRIFRNSPALRFMGRIHEELRENGQDVSHMAAVSPQELQLMHTGYSASVNRSKAERNLQLLLREMAETTVPERLYGYLADAYFGLDDREKAMQYARLDVKQGRRAVTYASRSYRILLPLLAENGNSFRERRETAAQAVAAFPELPEFHAEYAECLAYDFSYEDALCEARKALEVFAVPTGLEQSAFTQEQAELLKKRMLLWQQILQRMKTLRISAGVIVKNEAEEIGRWLDNAKVYSDEIIFVDTGSTDGTQEIARQHGVQVRNFQWVDDFSAARNFLISQASGDWIVSPDADEYFARPEILRAFLAEMDITQPAADGVMVISPNIDADCNNQEINRYPVVRIFRRRVDLRYVGNVHESLWSPRGELSFFMEKYRILLYHTGYSTRRVMRKTRRDLELLLKDIAANGEKPQHYRYLGSCYFSLKEYEKALHYDLLAIDAPVQSVGVNSDMYYEAIELLRILKHPLEEQLQLACRAIGQFPLLPDFYASQGTILCAMHRLEEGRASLEKARELFEHPQDQSGEATMGRNIMSGVYCRLGRFYVLDGNQEGACALMEKALALGKYNAEALTIYADAAGETVPERLAARLDSFFASDRQDTEYLMHWAEQGGFVGLYRYYAGLMEKKFGCRDELLDLYQLAEAQRWPELDAAVVQRAAVQIPELFSCLIHLQAAEEDTAAGLLERSWKLLPDSLQHILLRLAGKLETLQPDDFDGFKSMLPAVIRYDTAAQLLDYAALALDFSWPETNEIAGQLFDQEQWTAALSLYQEMPADSSVVTDGFWYRTGICLYQLQEREAAKECLERARDMGSAEKDIPAYLAWLEEVSS